MGYYINQRMPVHGKAQAIVDEYEGKIVTGLRWGDIPEGKAAICVLDNGPFDAAGFMYSESEFNYFLGVLDRTQTWVLMDLEAAKSISGYKG